MAARELGKGLGTWDSGPGIRSQDVPCMDPECTVFESESLGFYGLEAVTYRLAFSLMLAKACGSGVSRPALAISRWR